MHRIGIGRIPRTSTRPLSTPQVVEKRLAYMTPDMEAGIQVRHWPWRPVRNGMAIAGSPGWSESGGPWVPASHGMKEVRVERTA